MGTRRDPRRRRGPAHGPVRLLRLPSAVRGRDQRDVGAGDFLCRADVKLLIFAPKWAVLCLLAGRAQAVPDGLSVRRQGLYSSGQDSARTLVVMARLMDVRGVTHS